MSIPATHFEAMTDREQYQQILDRLDRIESRLFARESRDAVSATQISAHEKTLYGNGNPGIVERFNRSESRMDTAIKLLKWQIGILATMAAGSLAYFLPVIFG